jgi:hypothetical protein
VLTSTWPATALAAASSIAGVTRDAPDTIVPRPRPGYSSALLACPMVNVVPPYSTGGTGMPTATNALPLDQAITSAGIASIFEVGLEIGRTMGRSTV